MQIAKLVLFGLLGITACVASSSSPSSPSEPTETDSTETAAVTSSPEVIAPCGYTCTTNGNIEIPLRACQNNCPGGPQNCVPTPSPCP